MFYSNLYRRHLLDMHIEDWHEDFLSQFSPETYVENLKTAHVNMAMLYLQSHVGLCYYPTQTGVMHRAFGKQPDLMRRTEQLAHEAGIRVCGYYSLIYNTAEHDRHPDWRMVTETGKSRRESRQMDETLVFANPKAARYGLCCPNNPDYRAFVYAQIDEMLDYFSVDAMFFDMPFWPHTCHCPHCRAAFGKPIPTEDTPELIRFKSEAMGRFVASVTEYVKRCRPGMTVYHNYAQAVAGSATCGCSEEVLAACDYACGDLYGDLYNHSFACKFYKNATKNPPFEQMLSRCKPALQMHTLNKTRDQLCTAVASTMAHHGATLIIDAIDPVGTMDERVCRLIGEVFRFQMPYEPFFTGEMVEQVGVYYSLRSRTRRTESGPLSACTNLCRALIRSHIPFGVTGSFHGLESYPILAAPLLTEMDGGDNARLIRYVEQGGVLYLSGCGNKALVEALTGNRFVRTTQETNLYIAPKSGCEDLFGGFNAQYPMPFTCNAPVVEPRGAQVLATLTFPYTKPDELRFASIHSDPPGIPSEIPAVTVSDYGKGHVIWSALPIEDVVYPEYQQVMLNLLQYFGAPDWLLTCDAPGDVELTAFQTGDAVTVNAVALDEDVCSAERSPFTVRVRTQAAAVTLLPEGTPVPFTVEDGCTVFKTRPLCIFDMYRITKALPGRD